MRARIPRDPGPPACPRGGGGRAGSRWAKRFHLSVRSPHAPSRRPCPDRVLALTAAAVVTPLAAPLPAAADSVVVGGQPAPVADSPWAVALSSRDRFGGARSGQFCGGVVVAPTKVLTVAHCLGEEALGGPVSRVRDLRVIAGRERLSETTGQEIPVRGVWVNPAYDPDTNAGDLAVLTLSRALPRSSVIPMARAGTRRTGPVQERRSTGGGTRPGPVRTPRCCAPPASRSCPTPSAPAPTRAAGRVRTTPQGCSVRAIRGAGGMRARATAAGRWWPVGGSSAWSPGERLRAPGQPRGVHPGLGRREVGGGAYLRGWGRLTRRGPGRGPCAGEGPRTVGPSTAHGGGPPAGRFLACGEASRMGKARAHTVRPQTTE